MSSSNTYWNWDAIMEASKSEVSDLIDNMSEREFKSFVKEYYEATGSSDYRYSGRAQRKPREEDQEKLEPRAEAEKHWADRHDTETFDRPGKDGYDVTQTVSQAQAPEAPTNAPKPEVSPSFESVRRMLSGR
jgi:hypothetical protein